MANGSNGAPPESWAAHEDEAQQVTDPAVRRSLLFALERSREGWVARTRFEHAVTQQVFDLLGSSARVEHMLDHLVALERATAARVERLDGERELDREQLRVLDAAVASTGKRIADRSNRDVVARVRLEERLGAVERQLGHVREEVTETGRHAAVGEALGRKALESVTEEVTESREVRREEREQRRWTRRQIVQFVTAILTAIILTALAARFGAQNVPHVAPEPHHAVPPEHEVHATHEAP